MKGEKSMNLTLKTLNLTNFKSHRDLTVNFGEKTKITGDNEVGKSTISESITWTLYGVDMVGSKLDPTPTTYEADETTTTLLLNVDGKDLLLGRKLVNGTAKYYVNDAPSKANEFNDLLKQMFDKDLFLSLFNPSYFFTLHWEKQREMILQYVMAPSNKEVFKLMPKAQAEKLGELVKKHSLAKLEEKYRENKTKLEKQHIAAQSRTKTLKEQLEDTPTEKIENLQTELDKLEKERDAIESVTDGALTTNYRINGLQSRIQDLQEQITRSAKVTWPALKNREIKTDCRTCGQDLDEASQKVVMDNHQQEMNDHKTKHEGLVEERKTLEGDLKKLKYIDVSEELKKVHAIQDKIDPINRQINNIKRFESQTEQIKQAEISETSTLESLNESIFIIDAIKAFHAKEAELQVEKVQALFENLKIKLFKELKGGGETPTFEIEKDNKVYRQFSLSEGIRVGLELRDVLSEQSEITVPCFVDNTESITRYKRPTGQLITSLVVAGKELEVVVDGE